MRLSIELGPAPQRDRCDCCGGPRSEIEGWVEADGDSYACYFGAYTTGHGYLSLAVCFGGDDAGAEDRFAVLLRARARGDEFEFMVGGPDESPWELDTESFGPLLGRDEALAHPRIREAYRVGEALVREDPRVNAWLAEIARPN